MIIPQIAQPNMLNFDTSQKMIIYQFPGKLTFYFPFFINDFDITTGFILFCEIMKMCDKSSETIAIVKITDIKMKNIVVHCYM